MKEFSKINYPNLRLMKKARKKDASLYRDAFDLSWKIAADTRDSSGLLELYLYECFMDNKYTNYFIESDIYNFLNGIDIKWDENFFDLIKDHFVMEYNKEYKVVHSNNHESGEWVQGDSGFFSGVLHSRELSRSICFLIRYVYDYKNKIRSLQTFLTDGDDTYYFDYGNEEHFKVEIETTAVLKDAKRILMNMFYYVNAYPESIKSSPPNEVLDKLNKSNSRTLGISDEIAPYLTKEMAPHLRRGHFRHLGSDYYKKKRGTTIFVKPMFIHGDVKTITGDENG